MRWGMPPQNTNDAWWIEGLVEIEMTADADKENRRLYDGGDEAQESSLAEESSRGAFSVWFYQSQLWDVKMSDTEKS